MAFECMDDCIHLHACRRVQKIGKSLRLMVPRYCTEDCGTYLSKDTLTGCVLVEEAISYAQRGASSIENGFSAYDVYVPQDLSCFEITLGDLIDELTEAK